METSMGVGKILKRIAFEITFTIMIFVLMPIHYIQALFMLTIEVAKIYPTIIYDMCVRMFYGKDSEM